MAITLRNPEGAPLNKVQYDNTISSLVYSASIAGSGTGRTLELYYTGSTAFGSILNPRSVSVDLPQYYWAISDGTRNENLNTSATVTFSGLSGIETYYTASTNTLSISPTGLLKNTTDTLTGNLTVTGTLTAQDIHVQEITSSVVYSSGSNIFGESISNTHNFTGSLNVSGSGVYESTVTADNFITTSDRRLKSEITPIQGSLEKLKKFVSYEYIKNGEQDAGFIAQEVQETIPYSIGEGKDGYLTMRDRPILAHLHKAILELEERISAIEQKIG